MKLFWITFILILVWGHAGVIFSQVDSLQIVENDSLQIIISQADHLDETNRHVEALTLLQKTNETYPDTYEIVWRGARQVVEVGMMTGDKAKKEELFQQGIDIAKKAVELNSDHEEGHLRWAVAAGRLALFKGGDEKIKLSREVQEQAEAVLDIDPDHAAAHFILGRWHETLANLGWLKRTLAKMIYGALPEASNAEAIAHMEKACVSDPTFVEYRVVTGQTYIERIKDYEAARKHLQTAIELPPKRQGDAQWQADARRMLEKIKNK